MFLVSWVACVNVFVSVRYKSMLSSFNIEYMVRSAYQHVFVLSCSSFPRVIWAHLLVWPHPFSPSHIMCIHSCLHLRCHRRARNFSWTSVPCVKEVESSSEYRELSSCWRHTPWICGLWRCDSCVCVFSTRVSEVRSRVSGCGAWEGQTGLDRSGSKTVHITSAGHIVYNSHWGERYALFGQRNVIGCVVIWLFAVLKCQMSFFESF